MPPRATRMSASPSAIRRDASINRRTVLDDPDEDGPGHSQQQHQDADAHPGECGTLAWLVTSFRGRTDRTGLQCTCGRCITEAAGGAAGHRRPCQLTGGKATGLAGGRCQRCVRGPEAFHGSDSLLVDLEERLPRRYQPARVVVVLLHPVGALEPLSECALPLQELQQRRFVSDDGCNVGLIVTRRGVGEAGEVLAKAIEVMTDLRSASGAQRRVQRPSRTGPA